MESAAELSTKNGLCGLVQIMDLLGYEPSPWNKINIHVGGVSSSFPGSWPACTVNKWTRFYDEIETHLVWGAVRTDRCLSLVSSFNFDEVPRKPTPLLTLACGSRKSSG